MGEFSYCWRSAQNTHGNGYNAQAVNLNFFFQITNAFGHVLEEKLVAENYLRASFVPLI